MSKRDFLHLGLICLLPLAMTLALLGWGIEFLLAANRPRQNILNIVGLDTHRLSKVS
jgi:uncharacterized membrane protein